VLVSRGRFLSDDLWGLHEFLFCILIATRRWRGLAIGIGMIGLFILPVIAQVLVYLAR
jgi:hypothetical protein